MVTSVQPPGTVTESRLESSTMKRVPDDVDVAVLVDVGVKLNDCNTTSRAGRSAAQASCTMTTTVASSLAGLATTACHSDARSGPH
jgi:hypothetical protein